MIGKISSVALVLGLLSVPAVSAIGISEIIQINAIPANSDKPDLTIQNIGYGTIGDTQTVHVIFASTNNIGGIAEGRMDMSYSIKRLFSSNTVNSGTIVSYGGQLPGTIFFYGLAGTHGLPKFGFFRVDCEVNYNRLLEESNYDNNNASQNFVVLFGVWMPLS